MSVDYVTVMHHATQTKNEYNYYNKTVIALNNENTEK